MFQARIKENSEEIEGDEEMMLIKNDDEHARDSDEIMSDEDTSEE